MADSDSEPPLAVQVVSRLLFVYTVLQGVPGSFVLHQVFIWLMLSKKYPMKRVPNLNRYEVIVLTFGTLTPKFLLLDSTRVESNSKKWVKKDVKYQCNNLVMTKI